MRGDRGSSCGKWLELHSDDGSGEDAGAWQHHPVSSLTIGCVWGREVDRCRAVRNLRHLILREHKIDKEEELNETVDPIKRVRQQLDKVRLPGDTCLACTLRSSCHSRSTRSFMTLQLLHTKWHVLKRPDFDLANLNLSRWNPWIAVCLFLYSEVIFLPTNFLLLCFLIRNFSELWNGSLSRSGDTGNVSCLTRSRIEWPSKLVTRY